MVRVVVVGLIQNLIAQEIHVMKEGAPWGEWQVDPKMPPF
jgi:hypothetical protein